MSSSSEKAPACFGAASIFTRDSEVCKACPHFNECEAEAMRVLLKLRSIVNVEDIIKGHEKARKRAGIQNVTQSLAESTEVAIQPLERRTKEVSVKGFTINKKDEAALLVLKKNPKILALKLLQSGVMERMRQDLKAGINTFEGKSAKLFYMPIHLMLTRKSITSKDLRDAYMEYYNWSEGTAFSQSSIVLQVLVAFGFFQVLEDKTIILGKEYRV